MINNELMKSKEYQDLLIQTFDLKDVFEEKVVFTEDWIKFFKENSNPNASDNDFDMFRDLLNTFQKTEFLFMIDEIIIGIYNNEYIVSFNEGDYGLDFQGDTESNWMSNTFGWGINEEPKFKEICLKNFGIPIKDFDPCDTGIK